jgi:hypothetical protein
MSDYLWDRTGDPDPEVQRLEGLLQGYRWRGAPAGRLVRPRRRWLPPLAAAAALLVLVAGSWVALRFYRTGSLRPGGPASSWWEVETLAGVARVGSSEVREVGRLPVGGTLVTGDDGRARLALADIGRAEIGPASQVRLVETREREHRIALDRGSIEALVWAPPRHFFVDTPSATAVDLGCRFTLEVDDQGGTLLQVTTGWVEFERGGHPSIVPRGAACRTRKGVGPGTPYFRDAPEELVAALHRFDFERGGGPELGRVLEQARPRDTLTLWHLLARVDAGPDRTAVYDRMALLVPPEPAWADRPRTLQLDPGMLERWKDHLDREAW